MKYELEKILPHSYPMILIDEIEEVNLEEGYIFTNVTIKEDNLFFEKELNGVSYLLGIEFMAQTIAVYSHFKHNNQTPQIGFLLGTRSYKCSIPKFEHNKSYKIKAKEIFCDNELVSFECLIYNDDVECAKATVNAYQPQDATEFLKSGV